MCKMSASQTGGRVMGGGVEKRGTGGAPGQLSR